MSDLPPVAPVSEAEVRERLAQAPGYANPLPSVVISDPKGFPGTLSRVGLRYEGGTYYDLQERTNGG